MLLKPAHQYENKADSDRGDRGLQAPVPGIEQKGL